VACGRVVGARSYRRRAHPSSDRCAVRASRRLTRLFDPFVICRQARRVHVELVVEAQLVIEPVVREQAIDGYSENLRPILRREGLEPDVEKQRVGFPWRYASGPS
jgi:hypothetical protein